MKRKRLSWDEFFFALAYIYASRGTCDRLRVACILVNEKHILVGAGYNGSLPGDVHCDEDGHLLIDGHCVRTLHSEDNAILNSIGDLAGATAYIIAPPCIDCIKKLIAVGVKRIAYTGEYKNSKGLEYIKELAIKNSIVLEYKNVDFKSILNKVARVHKGPGGILNKDLTD